MPYKSEQDLVEAALNSIFIQELLSYKYKQTYHELEVRGLFGIPDLIIANKISNEETEKQMQTFAFEMKLSNWKRALMQAFRYRSFADCSYVILDNDKIKPAQKNVRAFINANIGLLGIDKNGIIHIYYEPIQEDPYSHKLTNNFRDIIMEEFKGTELKASV